VTVAPRVMGLNDPMTGARGMVVIVEDERTIAELERLYLTQAGFSVHLATDGAQGLADIRRLAPVAAIVDVGLPGMDGTEVVRALRAEQNWVPVVFVTAHDSEIDRVVGLELGADDYLTKPFSPRELVARVKGLVRRAALPSAPGVQRAGRLELDERARRVTVEGVPIDLTATEFDLLAFLLSHPGVVRTREDLLSEVWGYRDGSGPRTVDSHVRSVRRKIGADVIRTVHGIGYAGADGLGG